MKFDLNALKPTIADFADLIRRPKAISKLLRQLDSWTTDCMAKKPVFPARVSLEAKEAAVLLAIAHDMINPDAPLWPANPKHQNVHRYLVEGMIEGKWTKPAFSIGIFKFALKVFARDILGLLVGGPEALTKAEWADAAVLLYLLSFPNSNPTSKEIGDAYGLDEKTIRKSSSWKKMKATVLKKRVKFAESELGENDQALMDLTGSSPPARVRRRTGSSR